MKKETLMKPIPRRVAARPDPKDWTDTEVMTLEEAAALLFPSGGPITSSTLRSAYRSGLLEVVFLSRKILVNKAGIAAMTENAKRKVRD
jgi:hypothetical protein